MSARDLARVAAAVLLPLLLAGCALGQRPVTHPHDPSDDWALSALPLKGRPEAPLRLLAFADPLSLEWRGFYREIQREVAGADDVALVLVPLPGAEPAAQRVATSILVAHERGLAWDWHDLLCQQAGGGSEAELQRIAPWAGLDPAALGATGAADATLERARALARSLGVARGGAVLLNGRRVAGPACLAGALRAERAAVRRLLAQGVAAAEIAERRMHGAGDPHDPALRCPAELAPADAAPPAPDAASAPSATEPAAPASAAPALGSPAALLLQRLTGERPLLGTPAAPLTLVGFVDFRSPFYGRFASELHALHAAHPESFSFYLVHLPAARDLVSRQAAELYEYARARGEEWPVYDRLASAARRMEPRDLELLAMELGFDGDDLGAALAEGRHRARVQEDLALARQLGVRTSPTLLLAGRRMEGLQSYARLEGALRVALAQVAPLERNGLDPLAAFAARCPPATPLSPEAATLLDDGVRYAVPATGGAAVGAPLPLVTLVGFVSYGGSFTAQMQPVLDQLLQEYPAELRIVLRPVAWGPDPEGLRSLAARAARVAAAQGRFWDYHRRLSAQADPLSREVLLLHAWELGLDPGRFAAALEEPALADALAADEELGRRLGLLGTPAFYVNGRLVQGVRDFVALRAEVERARSEARARVARGLSRGRLYEQLQREGSSSAVFRGPRDGRPDAAR